MKITFRLMGIAAMGVILSSCGGTEFKKSKAGAPYKIFGDGKGPKIVEGNVVKFHIIQEVKDSVIYSSYGMAPRYQPMSAAPASYDPQSIVTDVLMNARKGDSIYLTMSMDTFIKRDPSILKNTSFKNGDKITTTIRVLDVFRTESEARADMDKENMAAFSKDPKIQEQKKKDEQAIEAHLAANNIKAERTPWGTYIQILSPGSGPKPSAGQYSMIRYTGMDLNGKTFDSNNTPDKPLMPLQIGSGGAIMGFEDGIKQLPKGARAKLYIPSVLGYGEMGSPPVIQPNQNLIFEVEIVDVTSTPPPPPQMPPMDTGRGQ